MSRSHIHGKQIKDDSIGSADIATGSIKASELHAEAISGQTIITSTDTSNDYLLIFDATDSTLKKVAVTHLGLGGSGISHDGSTADGVLTYKDSDEATVESNLTFDGSTLTVAGDILVNQYIKHGGDENTLINFADDKIILKAGGKAFLTLEEKGSAPHEITLNDGANNIDFVIKGNGSNAGNPGVMFDASNNRLGINGVGTPSYELDVAGDIGLNEYIYHKGDDDTFVRFETNNISLSAGGTAMTYDGTDLTVPGASSIYVDKIRRASDSSTTTKILLNDEAIKLYAGHSSDNICTIDSTGLKIDNGSLETATIDYTDGDLSMTIADGGKVTFAAGFDVGSDAAGDILYHNGTSYVRLAKGSADQVLTMNDAATAPNWETTSGGSSNEYFHFHISGRVKNSSTTGPVGHLAYPYSANESDWSYSMASIISSYSDGDATFVGSYVNAMLYWTIGVAPAAMALTSARVAYYMANDNMTDDYIWEIWKATPTDGTSYSTTLTWTRIGSLDHGGDPAATTFYAASDTFSSGNDVAAGDLIGLTVRNGDSYTNKYHGFHLAMRFTYS